MNTIATLLLNTTSSVVVKTLLVFLCFFGIHSATAQVVIPTNTTTGTTHSWTVPTGVVAIKIETWGGGGRGGTRTSSNGGAGGGGGGAYASSMIAVTPGQTYYYRVGAGSSTTAAGLNSWFRATTSTSNNPTNPIVLATGGNSVLNNSTTGANGGAASGCTGEIVLSGGNGGNGTTGGSGYSGGGGAGGGGNASGANEGTNAAGGGTGANGHTSGGADGLQGSIPGGGGSGGRANNNTDRAGGSGGDGRVMITAYMDYDGDDTQALCASPGRDGTTVTTYGGGNINTYYPGGVSVSAGATSVAVGAVPSGYGTTPIVAGDLLLIIQMQHAHINTTDTAAYGSIVYGYSVGYYEYIVAQSNVAVGGGTLTFRGAGTGNGLKYNYTTFNGTGDTNRGKGRYQIIRVPQYSSITLTSTITAPYWNGNVGGVVAMEVSSLLNFNGQTIHADNRGFRGGNSPNVDSGSNLTHYRTLETNNLGAGKGESIAGTPRYVWNLSTNTSLDNGATYQGGYSNGDFGRGAPANAGGGGNSHNGGGGGGSNSGAGGTGGFGYRAGWNANSHLTAADDRGIGGYSLFSIGAGVINNISHRVFMGGAGGRGDSNNNGTSYGGAGGGIVLISARRVAGTGTLRANGSAGGSTTSGDGGGGGGAGGTIFLNVANSSTATINLIANGGAGGNVTHNDIHGPGGGGGGGAVFYYAPGATINTTTNGGTSGTHSNWSNHGAGAGIGGSATNFTQIPDDLDRFNARCHVITNPMIRQKVK